MGGTVQDILAVDFTTDGHDTPTDFDNTTDLTILTQLEHDGTSVALIVTVDDIATTGFTATIDTYDKTTTSPDTGTLHWIAIGRTA
jgi:hypothetical protein